MVCRNYRLNAGEMLAVQATTKRGERYYYVARVALVYPYATSRYFGRLCGVFEEAQEFLDRFASNLKLKRMSKDELNDIFWGG